MSPFPLTTPLLLLTVLLPLGGVLAQAADPNPHQDFLKQRDEIILLAVEKVRSSHLDYQRAFKIGEDRLREIHESYRVRGSTPPHALERDVLELKKQTQKTRFIRSRGRPLEPHPEAIAKIQEYWDDYELFYEDIKRQATEEMKNKSGGSQAYWNATKSYDELTYHARRQLVYNVPEGQPAMDKVFAQNKWELLQLLEGPKVKTRGRVDCVISPDQYTRDINVDIAPFYRGQGLLPTVSPKRVAAFEIPVGCRTVTKRESGLKLIFRASQGRGVAYVGSTEKEVLYGYFTIPPDTAYYFENTSSQPFLLEYIALEP